MNNAPRLALLALGLVLTACVTERSGVSLPQPAPEEAAKINLEAGAKYLKQGKLQAAQAKLEKAVEQDPKLVAAHTTLALTYEGLEDRPAAERHYKRAVQLAPQDPDALNAYAAFLCRQPERRTEALKYFDQAIAVPQSVKFSNKAVLNANAGVCAKPLDLARAEDYLRAALRLAPDSAFALLQMADVAQRRGNSLQARAFLSRYLAAAPASPAALWLGIGIEEALGDTQAVARYAERLKRDFPESVETRRLLEQERDAG